MKLIKTVLLTLTIPLSGYLVAADKLANKNQTPTVTNSFNPGILTTLNEIGATYNCYSAVCLLRRGGFSGSIFLQNKQIDLPTPNTRTRLVRHLSDTQKKLGARCVTCYFKGGSVSSEEDHKMDHA